MTYPRVETRSDTLAWMHAPGVVDVTATEALQAAFYDDLPDICAHGIEQCHARGQEGHLP